MTWRGQDGVHANDSGEEVNLYEQEYSRDINAYGGLGDDVIRGNSNDNILTGGLGDDQLWGNTGSDTMDGGAGHDMYWWGRGDGADRIAGGNNTGDSVILYNITPGSGYTMSQQGSDLLFASANGSTLNLTNWYGTSSGSRVQSFVYGDRTAYAWNNGAGVAVSLADKIYEGNHINRLVSMDAGSSTLVGGRGDDYIQSGPGGNNHLWGGSGGNDTLNGGAGNDTFWYGMGGGQDKIMSNANDTLFLYNVQNSGQVTVARAGNDLQLLLGNNESVTLENWYAQGQQAMNRFRFADGSFAQIINDSWQPLNESKDGFHISVDYSRYDRAGFFNSHPERQAVVEEACRIWEGVIADEFPDIASGRAIDVVNPNTGELEHVTLDSPIDDLRLYVGSSFMQDNNVLGIACPFTLMQSGDMSLNERYNNPTVFEPWVGSLSINATNAGLLYFDSTPGDPYDDRVPVNRYDFLDIMVHEIGHILGFGAGRAGDQYVYQEGGVTYFNGPNARAAYGGPVPFDFASGVHIAPYANAASVMKPSLFMGQRYYPSAVDKGVLADMGYHIRG